EGDQSSSASVTVTTLNTAPVAEAGPAQSIAIGSAVQLNGSASSDADGDPLGYHWNLVSKPSGSAALLDDSESVTPAFTADLAGTYVAELVVNDGHNHTATDSVVISTLNGSPSADAGPPQTVSVGNLVQLNGSNSSDPDADPLTYAWVFTS